MLHQCNSKDDDDNYSNSNSNSNSNNKNVIYPGGSHYRSEIQHFPVGKETRVVDGHYAGLK